MEEKTLKFRNDDPIGIGQVKHTALIHLEITKSLWKEEYTLRGRIGVRFAQLLGIVEIKWK